MCFFVKYPLGEQQPSVKGKRTQAPTGVRVSMAERRRCLDVRTVDGGSSAKADLTLGAVLLSL